MSRSTTGYDTEAATLVARTLAAVAEAGPGAVGDEEDRHDDRLLAAIPSAAMVGRARSRGRRRPGVRAAVAATAAALAMLAGVALWPGDRSDLTIGPAGQDETPPPPAPGWLPGGTSADPDPLPATGDTGLDVDAAVLALQEGEGRGGEVLVAAVSHRDGTAVEGYEADWVATRLAGMFAGADDDAVVVVGGDDPRGYVAVPRGGASSDQAQETVDAYAAGALEASAGVWSVQRVPVGWVPGLAPTTGQGFTSGDGTSTLEVYLVAGDLPGGAQLGAVLGPIETRQVGDVSGWWWSPSGPEHEALLWQAAPGTIGVAVAGGLAPDDVVRVAESVDPAGAPSGGDGSVSRVVAESNEGADVPYRVEWEDRIPGEDEGPCVTLVLEGEAPVGPLCGFDHPDATFTQFGWVGRAGDADVFWGILGPAVARVTIDHPDGTSSSVQALPLDQGDPDSMRFVVVTVPSLDDGTSTARLLDRDGRALDSLSFDRSHAMLG